MSQGEAGQGLSDSVRKYRQSVFKLNYKIKKNAQRPRVARPASPPTIPATAAAKMAASALGGVPQSTVRGASPALVSSQNNLALSDQECERLASLGLMDTSCRDTEALLLKCQRASIWSNRAQLTPVVEGLSCNISCLWSCLIQSSPKLTEVEDERIKPAQAQPSNRISLYWHILSLAFTVLSLFNHTAGWQERQAVHTTLTHK